MEVGVQTHAPAALPPGKRSATHCIGGWVGRKTGLDGCGKRRPQGFDPWTFQSVAVPTELPRHTLAVIMWALGVTNSFYFKRSLDKRREREAVVEILTLVPVGNTWGEVDCVWNVMAHGDEREGKWRGNWRMEWVASTLHTTSEHGVSSITTAYGHTSAASNRLNWRPPPI